MTDIFRSRPDHFRAPVRRVGVLATVGIGALLFLAPTASAAGDAALTGGAPTAADRNAAQQALVSPETTNRLATFFVHLDQRATAQNGAVVQSKVAPEAAAAQAPQLVGAAVPVYSLNADFVRGGNPSAPVANFAYLATEARSAAGVEATVWTVRDRTSGAWRVTNVLSGADEVGYARQAGGDAVFTEPQIAAWYRVHEGRVLPLNPAAQQSVGPNGATLDDYRRLVHDRYADKLPGSTYQRDGKLGGFAATPSTHHGGSSAADIVLPASAAGVLVLGAGTLVIRRRRSATA
ncbi:hypothetical protein B4N89_39160 [Embleya scabrispora]|uniref:Uncharacterized protein n=1 Tax=Embleya scabrispora TaxID=159449 RepID=A0A1T3NP55_9ACTN|nr:hypothetical protein [Embleya scabrispora]OPC78518.1 hypothetical protein B4N89_39160 [Embleya scabrispora]